MKKSTQKIWVIGALALAISACTTLPKAPSTVLAQPNVPLQVPYTEDAQDTNAQDTSAPSLAATRWQDFYGDDKLKALIELGLANNKNLEQAILAIQKAKAQYQITHVANVPNINSSGSYSYGATNARDKNPSDSYSVGLGMSSYEFDFWGKVANQKHAALQSYLASNAAKDAAQISLISNIAQAYINISYAKAQLMLAESTVQSRERSLFITQKRFEAGIDSKSPSLQAESSLEVAKVAAENAKTTLAKAQNALQLLIGSPIPKELMPDAALTQIITPEVLHVGLPSELLFYRPDIAQAEYELKAAGANINIARAAFFPSISLSGNLGLASTDLSDLFKSSALNWSFGPSLSLPIFDAGSRRANYEVAKITQEQALVAYESAIQTAFSEVNNVLAERATMDARLSSQYKLQKNYQETYNIAYATFRSGLASYLDVLDAERSLFDIQQSILQLEQQKVISQISLYQVLGGGASLASDQITNTKTQELAMTSARLATEDEVERLAGARRPAVLQLASDTASDDTSSDTAKAQNAENDSALSK